MGSRRREPPAVYRGTQDTQGSIPLTGFKDKSAIVCTGEEHEVLHPEVSAEVTEGLVEPNDAAGGGAPRFCCRSSAAPTAAAGGSGGSKPAAAAASQRPHVLKRKESCPRTHSLPRSRLSARNSPPPRTPARNRQGDSAAERAGRQARLASEATAAPQTRVRRPAPRTKPGQPRAAPRRRPGTRADARR